VNLLIDCGFTIWEANAGKHWNRDELAFMQPTFWTEKCNIHLICPLIGNSKCLLTNCLISCFYCGRLWFSYFCAGRITDVPRLALRWPTAGPVDCGALAECEPFSLLTSAPWILEISGVAMGGLGVHCVVHCGEHGQFGEITPFDESWWVIHLYTDYSALGTSKRRCWKFHTAPLVANQGRASQPTLVSRMFADPPGLGSAPTSWINPGCRNVWVVDFCSYV